MRRWWQDALFSASALTLLLIALVSIDDRVHDYVTTVVRRSASPSGLASIGIQLREAGSVLVMAARDQSVENAPLMVFVTGAMLLVLFMVRS